MNKKANGVTILVIAIIVILTGLVAMGFDMVDANHIGVKNKMGKLIGIQHEGLQWTGFFVSVKQYSKMTRPFTIKIDNRSSAATSDGQSVFAIIKGNWKIKPEAVEEIYRNVGDNNQIFDTLNIEGRLKHGFKSVITKYSDGLDIINNRDEVMERAISSMKAQFPDEYAELEFIVIENIEYDAEYQKAIDGKKAAEQLALKAEEEKAITQANADKRVIDAEADRDVKKANADAVAYELTEIAKAEAKALELKRQQLTALMVENNRIDKWDGAYPKYMLGDSMMLFQMPNDNVQQIQQPEENLQ